MVRSCILLWCYGKDIFFKWSFLLNLLPHLDNRKVAVMKIPHPFLCRSNLSNNYRKCQNISLMCTTATTYATNDQMPNQYIIQFEGQLCNLELISQRSPNINIMGKSSVKALNWADDRQAKGRKEFEWCHTCSQNGLRLNHELMAKAQMR